MTWPDGSTYPSQSPTALWSDHFLDCPDCTLGDSPAEDVFCETGTALHEAAVRDMHERARKFPVHGERT